MPALPLLNLAALWVPARRDTLEESRALLHTSLLLLPQLLLQPFISSAKVISGHLPLAYNAN